MEGRELAPFRNRAKRLVNSIPPRLARSTVQWGAISLTDIAGAQTTLHEQNVTASADHTFNRLTLKLSGTLADYNYDDVTDPTLVGPVPFLDIRYCTEAVGTLRSSRCSVPSGAILCSALMAPTRSPTLSAIRRSISESRVASPPNIISFRSSVYGRYEHTAFISTDAASDFDEDEVRLGVKLRR